MADSATGGGGAGDMSPFLAYSYDDMKAMVNADNPASVTRYANQWADLGRDLATFSAMLHDERDFLHEVYASAEGAPAVMKELGDAVTELMDVSGRVHHNGHMLDVAAAALKTAQEKMAGIEPQATPDRAAFRDPSIRGPMATEAIPVMDELAGTYEVVARSLEFTPDKGEDSRYGSGDDGGGRGVSGDSTATGYVRHTPDSRGSSGGGDRTSVVGPVLGGSPVFARGGGADPLLDRHGARPVGGGPTPVVGTGSAAASDSSGKGTSTTTANTGGGKPGTRLRMPGARSGAPIGGYRPTGGVPGPGGTSSPGASPSHSGGPAGPGGPGGPGRPGMAAPSSPGGGGDGQQKKTQYEKLEHNTFRDTRHRAKPVIGEQRRKPDTFTPAPGTINSGKPTTDGPPKTPDLPTADAPARFEGHNVSFKRRPRGSS